MQVKPVVLLVDDDPVGQELFEAMLGGEGYELASAVDGAEALAKARSLVPDLILLDVMMPILDGFEVLRRLRADAQLAEIPVILVTALDDRDSRLRGVEVGADDFITKPIDRIELCTRVRSVTRQNRFRRLLSERAKFEWAVEMADDGFLIVGEGSEVSYANPRARELLGRPGRSLSGSFVDLARNQYRLEPADTWADWPDGAMGFRYLIRPETSSALPVWLEVETIPLPTPDVWLVRLRNVTEQVRAKREVWAFHSAIHHKLRTPLTAMVGGLEFLATSAGELPSDRVAKLASSALRGARRLQGEIEDILDYIEVSRELGSGNGCRAAELPDLARALAENLGVKSVSVKGIEGVSESQLTLSRKVVELLLGELLENSSKFHPAHEPTIEILLAPAGVDRISLVFRDDGTSVPQEPLARLLTPYYQAEKDHTGQRAGMGLGLSMVASVAWGAGGECRVKNREDRPGLVVELILPVHSGVAST